MITLKQNQHGLWSVPNLIEPDQSSGRVALARNILPEASMDIVFGRGLGAQHLASALGKPASGVLVVVGASSSKSPQIQAVLESILQTTSNTHIFQVQGHADHQTIRGGIKALQRIQATLVIVIGGGTTLDVGKAIAGLASQEDGQEIAAFQTGKRIIDPKRTLPWIAVPTTSGTGSESTNNAVVELGGEKRSIRNIPPPSMIIADPVFTDSLPLSHTIVSLVDAVAQTLEVITHAKSSPEIQAVGVAAFLNLAQGLKALMGKEKNVPRRSTLSGSADHSRKQIVLPTSSKNEISSQIRNTLSWGSLLMGISFAHAGLGLPHGLVHFCQKFSLSHGHMVGILLVPGLQVQAFHNPEVTLRLARVEHALTRSEQGHLFSLSFEDETTETSDPSSSKLLEWLEDSINKLFKQVGLSTSLRQAGLNRTDLEWIAAQEHALGASFGIPKRRATEDELMDVLKKAWSAVCSSL